MNSESRTANEIANLKSTILSMVILGSIGGALVGCAVNDKLGRIKSLYISLFFWAFGVILQVCTLTDNIAQLCSGRFIAGIGIGISVVVGPAYLVEISPSSIRGLCTCIFSTATYIGIMLGYFVNCGTSLHISNDSRLQWIIPVSLQLIFAGIVSILSWFAIEGPCWLRKVKKSEAAVENLVKVRNLPANHPFIEQEIDNIMMQLSIDGESSNQSKFTLLRKLFTT
jgi:MFS family permease